MPDTTAGTRQARARHGSVCLTSDHRRAAGAGWLPTNKHTRCWSGWAAYKLGVLLTRIVCGHANALVACRRSLVPANGKPLSFLN